MDSKTVKIIKIGSVELEQSASTAAVEVGTVNSTYELNYAKTYRVITLNIE